MTWLSPHRLRRRPYRLTALASEWFPLRSGSDYEAALAGAPPMIERALARSAAGFVAATERAAMPFIVATLLAHALKRYGPGSAPDLAAMLAAPALDCSNYGLLTLHIARALDPAGTARLPARFVGWESAAIGNHQTVFVESDGGRQLLLDPTVGVVCRATFDHIAAGRRVAPRDILVFEQQSELSGSRERVVLALTGGLLRPSELLYFFESDRHLLQNYGSPEHWPTPAAIAWRKTYGQARASE